MTRLVLGPFNRVEGDLEVRLDVADGAVREARVNAPLYRGFEQILRGKHPGDALVFTPRVCGICSVSQSAAAAAALAGLTGVQPPRNGQLAANLTHAVENVADHLSHFYLFFMPDFAREAYLGRPWFDAAAARFRAVSGTAAGEVLPARAHLLEAMGYLAGKWPHTLALQPGGSSRPIEAAEKVRLFALLREFRGFAERSLFGDCLEAVAALDSAAALQAWMAARAPAASDFRLFLEIAAQTGLEALGRASDLFMSYGSHCLDGARLFRAGVWRRGAVEPLDPAAISEDLSHAWMAGPAQPLHPAHGVTLPEADKEGAYTWCKAPRLAGAVVETGALARQVVDGQPLVCDLVARSGGNVANRVIARLVEIARMLPAMESWVRALEPGAPFHIQAELPEEGSSAGLVEAARGSLGHWLQVQRHRIANYQIIAPTTWNFSPRDAAGTPGALEQALVGTAVAHDAVAVQHVVRSFDPCMVCTVH